MLVGQISDLALGQTQIDPFQFTHKGTSGIKTQSLLDQAHAQGQPRLGRNRPQWTSGLTAKTCGHIKADQTSGAQGGTVAKKLGNALRQRPCLADPEQRLQPKPVIAGVGRSRTPLHTQPGQMAEMGLGERAPDGQWTPDPDLNPPVEQFASHHQTITTVVTRTHKHQNP